MGKIINERIFLFPQTENRTFIDVLGTVPFSADAPKRRAVLILPGGGYHHLCPREGEPIARRFWSRGYNTFVLHYSVTQETESLIDRESGFPKPIIEVMTAMAYIRRHAEKYHIDPEKITVIGFSAGGHLAACLSTLWDCEPILRAVKTTEKEVKPNAAILSYAVTYVGEQWQRQGTFASLFSDIADLDAAVKWFSPVRNVRENMCPCFLWHNADDTVVPVRHTLLMAQTLAEKHVPFELHMYPNGDHGLSAATPDALKTPPNAATEHVSAWMEKAFLWLDECVFSK